MPSDDTRGMTDDDHASQILLPDSFRALHSDARGRLQLPRADLFERYELCEDLAQQMTDPARHIHFDLGIAEDEVLTRCRAGLAAPESGLREDEARWVLCRLAELLGWDWSAWAGAETR